VNESRVIFFEVRWLLALGLLTLVLVALAEWKPTSELAVALAAVIFFSVLMQYGPIAIANLGV